jgi:hypothetical protein
MHGVFLAPYDFFPSHSSSDNPTKVDPLSLKGPLEKLGQRYYATTSGSTKLIAMKEITDKNFGLIIAFLLLFAFVVSGFVRQRQ